MKIILTKKEQARLQAALENAKGPGLQSSFKAALGLMIFSGKKVTFVTEKENKK